METNKNVAPNEIDNAKVLFFIIISEDQKHTGNTKSYVNGELMDAAYGLAICQYANDNGYYLFDCDENWKTINDTYHETIEDAVQQAEFEYENTITNWIKK